MTMTNNGTYGNVSPKVFEHPRLVFKEIGQREVEIIQYYIQTNQPFTVVIERKPNA